MTVHNHGTEDGPGLACPESRVSGELKGRCMNAQVIPAAALDAAVTAYINAARPVGLAEIEAILEAAAPHMRRTIATLEELDELPSETVIRDGEECVLERWGDLESSGWVAVMVTSFIPRDKITLPATVLYRPTP